MNEKDKQLLLQDLCARLPYKVMVKCNTDYRHEFYEELSVVHIMNFYQFEIKPYLRHMSSMTEEEEKQLQKIHQDFSADRKYNTYGCARADDGWVSIEDMDTIIDFLNEHHFDYKGLIEKGLALEAPEGMYDLNKE